VFKFELTSGGVAAWPDNAPMTVRKHLLDLLSDEPRSVSSLARLLGMTRGDVEEDLRHALRSARASGAEIEVIPARCKSCDFVFGEDKLTKPSRCPACKKTRLYEPMIRTSRTGPR
jgi:predicted Zn-ribbon and HTH transcriptional regulator